MKIETTQLSEAPNPQRTPEKDKALQGVARQFEAIFVNQMIGEMRKTVVKQGFVPEGPAEKLYQSMLDFEHSNQIAETEQIGLSKVIYEQLLRAHGGR